MAETETSFFKLFSNYIFAAPIAFTQLFFDRRCSAPNDHFLQLWLEENG